MVFNDTDGLYTYTFEAERKVTYIKFLFGLYYCYNYINFSTLFSTYGDDVKPGYDV